MGRNAEGGRGPSRVRPQAPAPPVASGRRRSRPVGRGPGRRKDPREDGTSRVRWDARTRVMTPWRPLTLPDAPGWMAAPRPSPVPDADTGASGGHLRPTLGIRSKFPSMSETIDALLAGFAGAGGPPRTGAGAEGGAVPERKAYTVEQYNRAVERKMKEFPRIWVKGVLTQVNRRGKVVYMELGDFAEGDARPRAVLPVMMWAWEFDQFAARFEIGRASCRERG